MFMDISSLDEDENEDKHSCCVSFLETDHTRKHIKLCLRK